ncbi:MAG: MOSC domain-containing protein [Chloroflexi bacterium]|nr:MOSC domain-containing protein [Chloroflexota bacterium]
MTINEIVGSVAGLRRFPVKSMRGEQPQEMELTEHGVLGDRAYALIDDDTGKVVSAKSVRLYPDLFEFSAAFIEAPRRDGSIPEVVITLPDGTSVRSDSGDVDRVLSAHFKRNVRLGRVAPDDFTIDQYHPDVEGADPGGNWDKFVAQPLGSALFAAIGADSPVPVGSFLDVFPMSVLTTSTLARLNELEPGSRFDERRFRMNVIVETERPRFVENDWVGHDLSFGDAARLNVTLPDPRCVMTTLAQEDLPRDTDVLRAIVRHNRLQVGDLGQFPCVGVYAVVGARGPVRIGDPVALD